MSCHQMLNGMHGIASWRLFCEVLYFMQTCEAMQRTSAAPNRDYRNLTFAQKAVVIQGPWNEF